MAKTALVLGATGHIGQHLVQQLISDQYWSKVVVVTRRRLQLDSEKVIEVITDASTIENSVQKLKADTVFCCLGTTQKKAGGPQNFKKIDHDYIVQCASLAHLQGAEHFLLISSAGAEIGSRNFYLNVKGETERDVVALGYKAVDILRPSLLLGDRKEQRIAEDLGKFFAPLLKVILVGSLEKYRPIEGKKVAEAMARIARVEHSGVKFHHYGTLAD